MMKNEHVFKLLHHINTSLGIILLASIFLALFINYDKLFQSSNVVRSHMIEALNERENTEKYVFNDFKVDLKNIRQSIDTKAKSPKEILAEGTYNYVYLPTNKIYTIVWKETVDGTFTIKSLY